MLGTRGLFLVLEGIDGSGTTSQKARLLGWLAARGRAAHGTAEPSTGPVGKLVRTMLAADGEPVDPHALALLFAADRRDHLAREIVPHLTAGAVVVCDRYVLSSLTYQTAAGVPREVVAEANRGVRTPDLTLLLDVPGHVAAERRQRRAGTVEIYDDAAVQERVAATYRREAEALIAAGQPVRILDGSGTMEEVEQALREAILPLI